MSRFHGAAGRTQQRLDESDGTTQSTGQKLADGFEKDYAVDISSLLSPNVPKHYPNSVRPSTRIPRAYLNLPPSPASSDEFSDGITSTINTMVPLPGTSGGLKWNFSSTRNSHNIRSKFSELEQRTYDSKPINLQRAPLRDLSSNGMREQEVLCKKAQTRRTSVASSQKENFDPTRQYKHFQEHGPPDGREHIPRNRPRGYTDLPNFAASGVEENTYSSHTSDSTLPTLSTHNRSTRFAQNKWTRSRKLSLSVDATLEFGVECQSTSSTVLHSRNLGSIQPDATETFTTSLSAHQRSSRSTRFSRRHTANLQSANVASLSKASVDGLNVSCNVPSKVYILPVQNCEQEDIIDLPRLVSDLQSRLHCIEKEKSSLNGGVQRLSGENADLFDRVKVLEDAHCAAIKRIGELGDEAISLRNRLQIFETMVRNSERVQLVTENNPGFRSRENISKAGSLMGDGKAKPSIEKEYSLQDEASNPEDAKSTTGHAPNDAKTVAAATAATEDTSQADTLLSLVDPEDVEDLRKRLEEARLSRKTRSASCFSTTDAAPHLPPLASVLAGIGVGVEIAEAGELESSLSEE